MLPNTLIFLVGPTAAGKSAVALRVAERIKGEIVSCDAMQVYREVRIANNRPSEADCMRVDHHLVGTVPVAEEYDVARFNQEARGAIEDILGRGKIPVVSGGSGMYMQVLLDGLFEGAGPDAQLREALKCRAEREGKESLYAELQQKDPEAAAKIHTNDLRRIIRALEVLEVNGEPISQLQKKRHGLDGKYPLRLFALSREREALYRRIETRVDLMFDHGLVDEVRSLAAVPLSKTARGIIGIDEVQGFLDGEYSEPEAKELMKMNTRRLAKRQLTWLRREQRLEWIHLSEETTPEQAAGQILERINE